MASEKSSNFLRNLIIVIVLVVIAFLIYMLYSNNIKTSMEATDYDQPTKQGKETYQEPVENRMMNRNQEEEMKESFTQGENTMDYYSMDKNFEEERNNSNFLLE